MYSCLLHTAIQSTLLNMIKYNFANSFRSASSYIEQHKNKTFILQVPISAIAQIPQIPLIPDIAILCSLNIKIIILIDPTVEIHAYAKQHKLLVTENQQLVIDNNLNNYIEELNARSIRKLEAYFASNNQYVSGLTTTSGNFITALPCPIENGNNYQNLGIIKNIDIQSIKTALDNKQIVLLTPRGYTSTGDNLYINASNIAVYLATNMQAEKIIFMSNKDGIHHNNQLIREIHPDNMKKFVDQDSHTNYLLKQASQVCLNNLARCHFLSYLDNNALLTELFTPQGAGTLISSQNSEYIVQATVNDIGSILNIINPLIEKDILLARDKRVLEAEINNFYLLKKDHTVIGCCGLRVGTQQNWAEMYCLAIADNYLGDKRGSTLVNYIIDLAFKQFRVSKIVLFSTNSMQWFKEKGFSIIDKADLPTEIAARYQAARQSHIMQLVAN